ncbi:MAG TPA: hypothetical protein VHA78_01715 [Candidatus Peribacteraceae bacterium]|nr:hypothetical protein [Candidatus Peribacteraceae bacterium]
MESTFITIGEATKKTGRSASTIRRLIRTITETADHPDREAVEPTAKEVAALKKKGENFTWRIREDVLMKNFEGALQQEKKLAATPTSDILDILQKELELKNQQIEKQWEVIHSLNDRLREGNILMGSLQKRLGPPAPESPAETVVEASSAKPSTEASAKKRGLFGWMKRS